MKLVLDEGAAGNTFKRLLRDSREYEYVEWPDLNYQASDGDKDKFLVKQAWQREAFVVTIDFTTITLEKFPPCKENSILQFGENAISGEYMFDRMEAFRKLFLAHRAKSHYSYLLDEGIKIIRLNEPIERLYHEYPESKHVTRGRKICRAGKKTSLGPQKRRR